MADATDILRATEGLREARDQATGSLAAGAKDTAQGLSDFADFFRQPDNLVALAICLIALVGIYRLLRAERIIPAPSRGGGLFSSVLAQRLAVRLILGLVVVAVTLALLAMRLTVLVEFARSLF